MRLSTQFNRIPKGDLFPAAIYHGRNTGGRIRWQTNGRAGTPTWKIGIGIAATPLRPCHWGMVIGQPYQILKDAGTPLPPALPGKRRR